MIIILVGCSHGVKLESGISSFPFFRPFCCHRIRPFYGHRRARLYFSFSNVDLQLSSHFSGISPSNSMISELSAPITEKLCSSPCHDSLIRKEHLEVFLRLVRLNGFFLKLESPHEKKSFGLRELHYLTFTAQMLERVIFPRETLYEYEARISATYSLSSQL